MKPFSTFIFGLTVAFGLSFGWSPSPIFAAEPEAIAATRLASTLPREKEALAATDHRPVIGITTLTSKTYVKAIRRSGGVPVVLPMIQGPYEEEALARIVDEYVDIIDGLLMPGGPDIPPSEWGEEVHPTTNLLDEDRYRFEKAIITTWIQRTDKPLLGICLGSQWINVAHGGSLFQDIPSAFGTNHRNIFHNVVLEPDSRLSQILGGTKFEVNSLHHQAVRNVGEGLRAVATAGDGVIEATETTDPDRFLIGVQWHPEKLIPDDPAQQKLFQAFIDAAALVSH
ncbi:putative glutamine amidotransferase [Neorhodopirellula lusitana]|uniref:Glutamine amidotransferase n=1 Tax=Neorhodopirellula lusitana TaxID=445327 RepID=A0ABY1Q225_9BACT|nr:gamma-glutamyl-gamma-aminobutyrate hydrolase family protein [Neorhodopirellula lusitana]SMP56237.1 putative glutamine amidotransferase [Neorhodopirellula lusitana]